MPSDDKGIKELMELLNSKVLSNSARLGILIALYYEKKMSFSELLSFSSLPKSSLAFHLQVLEEEGLIEVKKVLTISGVRTQIVITNKGKEVVRKFLEYVKGLKG